MNPKVKIGLIPFYLKLYDDQFPQLRKEFEPFLQVITHKFEQEKIEVVRSPICRLRTEFEQAIHVFQMEKIDLLVTIHLAYSLSMEAVEVLVSAPFPILMLDTTMDFDFSQNADPNRLMFNHGIHGVQDLACMLRRGKRNFAIVAGHFQESNIIYRATEIAKAARAAHCLKTMRVLRIGNAFEGMGDFRVPESVLQNSLGIHVTEIHPSLLGNAIEAIGKDEIEKEITQDQERYRVEISSEVHQRSVRVGLGLRHFLEEGHFSSLTFNFLSFDNPSPPVDTVPFLEASKAMARGIGYAGEGDVLTAALVGALAASFGKTTFTEAFCPDWKNHSLFLSHMGEINPEISAQPALLCEKDFPWAGARNPAQLACAPAAGPATWVNLAPGPNHTFRLIITPVQVLEDSSRPEFQTMVRGWIRPSCRLETFLETYSRLGGTHHSALMMGDHSEAINALASFAGIEGIKIES